MPQVSILLFLAAAMALLVAWLVRRHWMQRGARPLALMQLAAAWWCIGYGFENLTTSPDQAALWAALEYVAIVSLPVLWLTFALEYTQQEKYLRRTWRFEVWIIPVLILVAVATNSFHHLFWVRVEYVADAVILAMVFRHGLLFWVHSIYSYGLMLAGVVVFMISGLRYPKYYRQQVTLIVIAALVPCFANLFYLLKLNPLPGIDITPLSFVLSGAVIVYGISQAGLFNLTPIAQDLLFDNIPDGIVILDEKARMVNLNPAAYALLSIPELSRFGMPITTYIAQWEAIFPKLAALNRLQEVLYFTKTQRYVEMTVSSLYGINNLLIGWVLVLRDVSPWHLMQEELKSQAEQLKHVINHVPSALMYISLEERLIFFNQAFVDWIQQPPEMIDGKLASDILPEKTYLRMAHYFQIARAGERISFDTLFENTDGSPFYAHVDMIPRRNEDGNVIGVLVISHDITERHDIERNEQEQRAWAEALRQTVAALNSTLEYDEVLDIILDRIAVVLPHDAANIALLDPQAGIRIWRSRGYGRYSKPEVESYPPYAIAKFPNWRKMIETARPMAIPDTSQDADWEVLPDYKWVRSYAGAPICIGERVIGFLSLDSATPGFFSQSHADHLMSFANEAAVAIEKARLYADVRRRADELASINRIANAITAGLDLERVMAAILEQCQQVLPLDVFYIALYNEEEDLIDLPLFFDLGQIRSTPVRRLAENPGLTGHIILNRQTVYIPDVLEPGFDSPVNIIHLGGVSSRCYLGIPLILRDRVIGVISIQTYYPAAYTPEQVRLFEVIGTQAAIALENARLYAQAQHMAITDSLTGLYNRRYLLERARQLIRAASEDGDLLSIILLDGDWFKRINDTYGHLAGDQALKAIAQSCQEHLRPQDVAGRFGGEEFCILLPGLALSAAGGVAEIIRTALVAQVITRETISFTISASFGVAQYLMGETLEQVLSRADTALYRAKTNGRNQTELASA